VTAHLPELQESRAPREFCPVLSSFGSSLSWGPGRVGFCGVWWGGAPPQPGPFSPPLAARGQFMSSETQPSRIRLPPPSALPALKPSPFLCGQMDSVRPHRNRSLNIRMPPPSHLRTFPLPLTTAFRCTEEYPSVRRLFFFKTPFFFFFR